MSRGRASSRRQLIRRLLSQREVVVQEELQGLVAAAGHRVTQSTISRDLAAIGASKQPEAEGGRYVVGGRRPGEDDRSALRRAMGELALEVRRSGDLVVVKTLPGAAQAVAGFLDRAGVEGALGTVAGDDTILVVAEAAGGARLSRRIERLIE